MAVLLCAATAARAQEPSPKGPERALLRLMAKGSQASYSGTQTIEMRVRGRQVTGRARVAHFHRTTRTEILSPTRLKGMVVLERGGRRVVLRPGSDRWQSTVGGAPPPQPRRMLANYTVADQGSAVVAGRPASILEVRARVGGKLARKIWLDRETGVVLRSETYNWSGQLVSATEFEEIDYTPQHDERDFDIDAIQRVAGPQGAGVPVDPTGVPRPSYTPPGFELVGRPNGVRTRRGVAAHLRYSDGLNTISVFIRKLAEGEDPNSPGALPAMEQPFSAVVHHIKGSYRVTVIGDVDPSELRRMADSIE